MAYSEVWNELFPPDTQPANLLGDDIRSFKTDIRERLGTYLSGPLANQPTPEAIWAGLLYFATDVGAIYQWSGTAWVDVTAIFVDQVINVIPFSSTPIFAVGSGNVFDITLTGNVTSSSFTGAVNGQTYIWIIRQDGVGGRTFVWPGSVPGPIVNSAAGAVTVFVAVVDSLGNVQPYFVQLQTIAGVGEVDQSADIPLPNNTPTILASETITMPAQGGPWRVLVSYSMYMTTALGNAGSSTAWVSDGANNLATVQASNELTLGGVDIGISGCEMSPSYANGAVVTFTLLAIQGTNHAQTAKQLPALGGGSQQPARLQLAVLSSN